MWKRVASLIDSLPAKGTYTLIIFLPRRIRVGIGKLGIKVFSRGYYTYTGSALGTGASSLKRRILRHWRKTGKKKRWHIDFLLARRDAAVTTIVAAQTKRTMECRLNRLSMKEMGARIPVPGFGSSDCRRSCGSHLLFYPDITEEKELVEKVVSLYESFGCDPLPLRMFAGPEM